MKNPEPDEEMVDPELLALVPLFVENRRQDLEELRAAVDARDFATARRLGHSMKGAGSVFGFSDISALGAKIEQAAMSADAHQVAALINELAQWVALTEAGPYAASDVGDLPSGSQP